MLTLCVCVYEQVQYVANKFYFTYVQYTYNVQYKHQSSTLLPSYTRTRTHTHKAVRSHNLSQSATATGRYNRWFFRLLLRNNGEVQILHVTHSYDRGFRGVRKIVKIVCQLCHVSMSVRTEQLGHHWTDSHGIWYLSIFRISVEKIQIPLKYDKNKG